MFSFLKNDKSPDNSIENLLINAKNTLPNEIIRFYSKNNYIAFKYEEIFNEISPIYYSLRRADKKRYGKNIKKGIIATLNSIDLFTFDKEKKLYILNKNTALEILQRTQKKKKKKPNDIIFKHENIYEINESETEKNENEEDINKDKENYIEKNKDYNDKENELKNDYLLGKKRNNIIKTLPNNNYPIKYFLAYDLLDELLDKYINILNGKKNLINPFLKVNNIADLIAKIKDKDKIEGMLTCFKFFKPILRKFVLYRNKPRQINKDLNTFNKGIDFVNKYFNFEKE